jgi:hypothetical protein
MARRWLVDTGSAHDIVRDSAIRNCPQWKTEMREPLALSTANGVMQANEVCHLSVPALAIDIDAVVLPSTPCLLSVGARCMEEGFTFVWRAKRAPYFITPDGKRIQCEVHNRCPYLSADAPSCAAVRGDPADDLIDSEAETELALPDTVPPQECVDAPEAGEPAVGACPNVADWEAVASESSGRSWSVRAEVAMRESRLPADFRDLPPEGQRAVVGQTIWRELLLAFPSHAGVLTELLMSRRTLQSLITDVGYPLRVIEEARHILVSERVPCDQGSWETPTAAPALVASGGIIRPEASSWR